jgi:ABC-type transport system involved in cytochrome c biogenesis ATPase subunit
MNRDSERGALLVDQLEIQNFRIYEHLLFERFGRANLIVGRNNTGKTSLLEALRIFASMASPYVLWDIISSRDEIAQAFGRAVARKADQYGLMNLYSRSSDREAYLLIRTRSRALKVEFAWYREISEGEQGYRIEKVLDPPEDDLVDLRAILEVRDAESVIRRVFLNRRYVRSRSEPLGSESECVYVSSGGVSATEIARLWDKVTLTPLEAEVTSSLAMIYPGLERISLAAGEDERTRIARAKLSDSDYPVPLKSLGEGVNRIFGIVLGLVSARNGLLLIDEVENGIHYSVQPQLWRFLIETSQRLNVQVFATTHSSDAIRAFTWASSNSGRTDGTLTRLEERNGRIEVHQFDGSDLHIALTEAIEVR